MAFEVSVSARISIIKAMQNVLPQYVFIVNSDAIYLLNSLFLAFKRKIYIFIVTIRMILSLCLVSHCHIQDVPTFNNLV